MMMDLEKILLPVTSVFYISLEDISYPLLFYLCCFIRRFMIHNQICDKDAYNGRKMEYSSFSYVLNFVVNCERGYMNIRGWKEGETNVHEMIQTERKRFFETFFLINSLLVRERYREIFLSSLLWQQLKTSVVKNACYGINHRWYNRKIWTNSRDHYQLYGSIKKNCCNFSEIGKNNKKKKRKKTFHQLFIYTSYFSLFFFITFFFYFQIAYKNRGFIRFLVTKKYRASTSSRSIIKFSVRIISILFWGEEHHSRETKHMFHILHV